MYERPDGKVGFRVGRWIAPEVTLTPEDFFRFELTAGTWGQPDEIAPIYIEPENAWRETPAGAWVTRASAKPVREEPRLYLVHNHNQASRIAKRVGRTKHAAWSLQGTVGLIGYELLSQRFFRVTHPEMGVDAYFEIGEMRREGPARFSLIANSVDPGDFDFDAATEEPTQPDYSGVINDGTIPVPSNLVGQAVSGGGIRFSWDPQDGGLVQEIRYRPVGETYWLTSVTSGSAETLQITGLEDGATYEAQIRNRTAGAGVSDWGPADPLEVVAIVNVTPPAALASFSVSGVSTQTISFTAPNDPQYFGTRIYVQRNISQPTFADANILTVEYGIPSNADSYTTSAGGSYFNHYWAEPINASGVAGPRSGPVTQLGPDGD
jgi:hypothetical protein